MGAVAPVAAVLPTPLPAEIPNQIVQHFWYCHRTAMAILTVADSINWQTEDLSMAGFVCTSTWTCLWRCTRSQQDLLLHDCCYLIQKFVSSQTTLTHWYVLGSCCCQTMWFSCSHLPIKPHDVAATCIRVGQSLWSKSTYKMLFW